MSIEWGEAPPRGDRTPALTEPLQAVLDAAREAAGAQGRRECIRAWDQLDAAVSALVRWCRSMAA